MVVAGVFDESAAAVHIFLVAPNPSKYLVVPDPKTKPGDKRKVVGQANWAPRETPLIARLDRTLRASYGWRVMLLFQSRRRKVDPKKLA